MTSNLYRDIFKKNIILTKLRSQFENCDVQLNQNLPLRSKKAGRFEKLLGLLEVTRLWHVAHWVSRAPPHHALPAFLNLNDRFSSISFGWLDQIWSKLYGLSLIYVISLQGYTRRRRNRQKLKFLIILIRLSLSSNVRNLMIHIWT